MKTPNQNPEQIARDQIDKHLEESGWIVQDKMAIDFSAGLGIAVREYQTDIGPADYVLFVVIQGSRPASLHLLEVIPTLHVAHEKQAFKRLYSYDFISNPKNYELDKKQKEFLKHNMFTGNEIVANTRRLCLMNMFLHNIGEIDGQAMISPNDALVAPSGKSFDYVLANPPFGKKSSMSFTNEEGEQETDDLTYNRQDFWATTANKQLNFVQHIRTMLKTTGRAAVVAPDNVLFEGGAGEIVRRKLLENTDLHTILRLPTGIFYANGVKANVIFFDNHEASPKPWTKDVWFYDYRTNVHHTLKKKTMRFDDLADFIKCYNPENRHKRKPTWDADENPEGRWRKFSYDELKARDKTSLDVFWLRDKSLTDLDNLPEPDELAEEIIENLEAGLNSFKEVLAGLQKTI